MAAYNYRQPMTSYSRLILTIALYLAWFSRYDDINFLALRAF